MVKFCSKCNEKMSEGDIVCKYCGTFLSSNEQPASPPDQKTGSKAGTITWIIIILLIVAAIVFYFSK
nr:zinc ribbon domain-containing protein [Paenibacillus sp. UNC451MF]